MCRLCAAAPASECLVQAQPMASVVLARGIGLPLACVYPVATGCPPWRGEDSLRDATRLRQRLEFQRARSRDPADPRSASGGCWASRPRWRGGHGVRINPAALAATDAPVEDPSAFSEEGWR